MSDVPPKLARQHSHVQITNEIKSYEAEIDKLTRANAIFDEKTAEIEARGVTEGALPSDSLKQQTKKLQRDTKSAQQLEHIDIQIQKRDSLNSAYASLIRLETYIHGTSILNVNDIRDIRDRDEIVQINQDLKNIGLFISRYYTPLNLVTRRFFSKTYNIMSTFITDYENLKKKYIECVEFWPSNYTELEEVLQYYNETHNTWLSKIRIFKKTLSTTSNDYDVLLEKFIENYNNEDGTLIRLVTNLDEDEEGNLMYEGNFMYEFNILNTRLDLLKNAITMSQGEANMNDQLKRSIQCQLHKPTTLDTIIFNLVTILPLLGQHKADFTYKYNDMYKWLHDKGFIGLDKNPTLGDIWETFLNDTALHVVVSSDAKRIITDQCLPKDQFASLEQPIGIYYDTNLEKQQFANCRASGDKDSYSCKNFCQNINPRYKDYVTSEKTCYVALDTVNTWPVAYNESDRNTGESLPAFHKRRLADDVEKVQKELIRQRSRAQNNI